MNLIPHPHAQPRLHIVHSVNVLNELSEHMEAEGHVLFILIIKGLYILETQPLDMVLIAVWFMSLGRLSYIFVDAGIIFKTKVETYLACSSVTCFPFSNILWTQLHIST